MGKTLIGIGLVLALAACSSSSGGGGGGGKGSNAAAAQCDALVDKICQKAGPCQNQSVAQCVTDANNSFQASFGDTCDGADAVGSSYNTCLTDMDAWTCTTGQPPPGLPATCQNVILFQQ
jgi:hypothetical protein